MKTVITAHKHCSTVTADKLADGNQRRGSSYN